MKEEYLWTFPMNGYENAYGKRLTRMEEMLIEVRKIRDKEMTSKKRNEIEKIKKQQEQQKSFAMGEGFLSGMNSIAVGGMPSSSMAGYNTNFAGGNNYNSSGGLDGGQSYVSHMYDDTSTRGQVRSRALRAIERGKRWV